ncbi:MAG: alkaline phosphatase family protein [Acidimicrobiales bacterium]
MSDLRWGASGHFTGRSLPFTWAAATTFPICDRHFCSVLAGSHPNHRYLYTGTSFGIIGDAPTYPDPPVITGTGFSATGTGSASGRYDLATLVTCGSSASCSALTPPGRGTATVVAVADGFPSAPDPPGDRFNHFPSN